LSGAGQSENLRIKRRIEVISANRSARSAAGRLIMRATGAALLFGLVWSGPAAGLAVSNAQESKDTLQSRPHQSDQEAAQRDESAELSKVEALIARGDYLESVTLLREYLQDHPSSWRGHYDLGYVLFRVRTGPASLEDNLKESIRELSRSLQLNSSNADAHKILGLDLTMIQRDDLALVEFERAVQLDPGSAENHYFLGRHFMGQSEYSKAAKELEVAIQINPKYMKAYDNLGISLDRLGDRQTALMNLKAAVELDEAGREHSEQPYLDLARFYHDDNRLQDALELAIKAVKANPRSEDGLLELAKIYRAQAQWNKALDVLLRAIALNPESAQTYYLIGLTYHSLGNQSESQKAFQSFDKYRRIAEMPPRAGQAADPH
jgi:superkiller protein 3